MRPLLLFFCGLLSTMTPADSPQYWLTRGLEWQGIKIAGQTLRTRDILCRDERCYVITDVGTPISNTMRHYGLSNVNFETLSKIAIDKRGDTQIRLPDDLGQELFIRALREDRRDDDKKKVWPP